MSVVGQERLGLQPRLKAFQERLGLQPRLDAFLSGSSFAVRDAVRPWSSAMASASLPARVRRVTSPMSILVKLCMVVILRGPKQAGAPIQGRNGVKRQAIRSASAAFTAALA
nr:hypothetical protein [Methylobacterium sp. WSM2598]